MQWIWLSIPWMFLGKQTTAKTMVLCPKSWQILPIKHSLQMGSIVVLQNLTKQCPDMAEDFKNRGGLVWTNSWQLDFCNAPMSSSNTSQTKDRKWLQWQKILELTFQMNCCLKLCWQIKNVLLFYQKVKELEFLGSKDVVIPQMEWVMSSNWPSSSERCSLGSFKESVECLALNNIISCNHH